MQKMYALALLLLFTFLQYGKLISYWNCKVTNSGDTSTVQCDCEKILLETNDTGDPSLSSKNNIKDKTEECFAFYSVQLLLVYQMHLELGRIVERPVISWERDVLAIVQAQNYEPNYKIVRHPHTLFRSRTLDKIENDLVKIAIKFNVIFLQRKCLRSVWGCVLKDWETI